MILSCTRLMLTKLAGGATRAAVVAVALVLAAGPVWGQCQMCKKTASYQKASAIEALNQGIILLAIPPVAIIGGIAWLTYRHRDGYRPDPRS